MTHSTWTWIGNSSDPSQPSNWSPTGGPPRAGDTAIIPGGVVPPLLLDPSFSSNTLDLVGNGTLDISNDSTFVSNASLDALSVINATGTATTLSIAGPFGNAGTIEVTGTNASLSIPITAGAAAPGLLDNTGQIIVSQGDTLAINGGTIFDPGAVMVNGGTAVMSGTLDGLGNYAVGAGGSLTLNDAGTIGLTEITFTGGNGSTGFVKLGDPEAFDGNINGFAVGDTLDLGPLNISTVVFDGNGDIIALNSSGTVFEANASGALGGDGNQGTFTLSGTGGLAGYLQVTEGSGDTVITALPPLPTTWLWQSPNSFSVLSGPGNGFDSPTGGDTVIATGGTAQVGTNTQFTSNTIELGGTLGVVAELSGAGNSGTNLQSPSIDGNSLITSDVVAAGTFAGNSTPEISVLNAQGTWINEGTIQADGPAGSSFTIDISAATVNGTFQPGYFINYNQIEVDAGNSMTITVAGTSELFNAGMILVNGGSLLVNVATNAVGGGYGGENGAVVIMGGGTVETNAAYASTDTAMKPTYAFGDATAGNTLKIDNAGSFGGNINGFGQNDTIDLGASLSVGSVVYSSSTGILSLDNASGTVVASLVFGSGNFQSGTFTVSGGTAGSFSISTGADGDTILTTAVQNDTEDASGVWQTANWSNGEPGPLDTAIIGLGAPSPFVLTTGSSPVSVGALELTSNDALLQITSNTTVSPYPIREYAGTIEVTSGQTLTSPQLVMLGGTTEIDPTALLDLTGDPNYGTTGAINNKTTVSNTGTNAVVLGSGAILVNGGTLDAGIAQSGGNGGRIFIGYEGGGTPGVMTVQNSGTNAGVVTDTYSILSSDPTSFGVLTLDGNVSWTDEIDPHDTTNTRGYMDIGSNNQAGNSGTVASPPFSGAATLAVENGATLTEQTFAIIGQSIDSAGSVLVSDGLWNVGASALGGYLTIGQAGGGTLTVMNGGTVAVGTPGTFFSNGASFTGSGITVGQSASATGTLTVTGAGALVTDKAGMNVGQAGPGDVQVLNGGTIQLTGTLGINVGVSASGPGTLLVSGTDPGTGAPALLSMGSTSKGISVGVSAGATATLDVESGGTIQMNGTGGIGVGQSLSAHGLIIVNGPNALLNEGTASTGMSIGQSGSGTLQVTNGGTLLDQSTLGGGGISAGQNAGGQGLILVSGTNSLLSLVTPNANLNIGNAGQGTLNVQSGGTVSINANGGLTIGTNSTGSGTVSVSGSGSSITVLGTNGGINVGNSGSGTLDVLGGGLVRNTGTGSVNIGGSSAGASGVVLINGGTLSDANGYFSVGNTNASGSLVVEGNGLLTTNGANIDATGTGHATVTVSAGTWTSTNWITVGNAGSGSLDINSLGLVLNSGTSGINVGNSAGATGVISVESGGTLITGNLDVASPFNGGSSTGIVTVGDGGTVEVGSIQEGGGGTITVGGTASPALLTSSGNINIGQSGSTAALLTVNHLGTVTNSGTFALQIGGNTGTNGTVTVNGGTLTTNGIDVGGAGTGALVVENGGLVIDNGGTQSTSVGSAFGSGFSGSGSLIINGGTLNETGQSFSVGGTNTTGTLLVEGGGLLSTAISAGSFGVAGEINASGTGRAAATVSGGTWDVNGQLNVGDSGSGSLDINSYGLVVNTGTNGIGIGNQAGASGTVSVESGGTLIGTNLNVANSFTGTATGVLNVGDGGTVQVGSLSEGGGGTITVGSTASPALLTDSGYMNIGQSGGTPALLTVNQLGTVTNTGTFALQIGANAGSFGTVTVNGGTLTAGGIGVGGTGTGALIVENGGLVIDNGGTNQGTDIGSAFGSGFSGSGTLVINGGTLNETGPTFNVGGTNTAGTLVVENGGLLNTSVTAGLFSGFAGEINASGTGQASAIVSGGTWNVNGQFNVGDNGTGSLDINSNGLVDATSYYGIGIGNQAGAAGTVSVESGGTLISTAGGLSLADTFGGTASGVLNIGDGGTVEVSQIREGGGGTITVGGTAHSALLSGGSLNEIGQFGTGAALIVNESGTVTGGDFMIGNGGSSTVTVNGGTLTGGGSFGGINLTNSSVLTVEGGGLVSLVSSASSVGDNGSSIVVNGGTLSDAGAFSVMAYTTTGTVLVENGGTLITGNSTAVSDIYGSGTAQAAATVSDGIWTSNGQLIVGDNGGAGSLDINSNGVVNAGTNGISIGNDAGASGIVSVESGGTLSGGSLNIANVPTGTASGVLTVGDNGTVQVGSLTESGGGTITVGGTADPALLTASGAVTIGQSGTGAVLFVNELGTVTDSSSFALQIGSGLGTGGTVTVNGGTLTTAGGFTVGDGTLTVEGGGLVSNTGANNVNVGGTSPGNNGTVVVNGGTLSDAAGFFVGSLGGSGTVAVGSGGTLITGNSTALSDIYAIGAAQAAVTVSDGTWISNGQLTVGDNGGAGSLDINSNGVVNADDNSVTIGQAAGSPGTISLESGGTLLAGSLTIGQNSTGAVLSMTGGEVVTTGNMTVAGGLGSSGTVTVSGGTLDAGGLLTIGSQGNGLVTVNSGGSLIAADGLQIDLRVSPGNGTLVVNGGSVTSSGGLSIGTGGTAVVIVEAGGSFVATGSGAFEIGSASGGTASVTVNDGLFSTSGGPLFIGSGGNGSMLVENTGTVVTTFTGSGPAVDINAYGTAQAGVTVTGASSVWDVNAGTGQFVVGDDGGGSLTVSAGGMVNTGTSDAVDIGNLSGGNGTVTVGGGGAEFAGGSVYVGTAGTGTLTVNSGGTVQADSNLSIGSAGALVLGGGTLSSPGSANNGGQISGFGTFLGALTNSGTLIASGGTLDVNGGITGTGQITIAGTAVLNVDGTLGNSQSVTFATPASPEELILNAPGASFGGAITGLNTGDLIELNLGGSRITSASVTSPGTITAITNNGSYLLTDVSFANSGTPTFLTGFDAATGDSYVQVGTFASVASWAIDTSGDFDDPTKWSIGSVPGAGSDATIDFADQPQVVHDSGNDTLNSLTNTAGNLVMSGGMLTLGTLTNDSAMSWSGGSLVLDSGTLLNAAGATLSIAPNGQRLTPVGTALVANAGTILVAAGSGVANIDAPLTNTGSIIVNQGTLSLNGGGSSNGAGLAGGLGGTLQFGLPAPSVEDATFTVTGGEYAVDNTTISGGTLDVSAASSAFFVNSLRLAGAGTLLLGAVNATAQNGFVQGPTSWAGATGTPFLSGTGTLTVYGGGSLINGVESGPGLTKLFGMSQLGGSPAFDLDGGRTVENDGWLIWSSGNIELGAGDSSAATQSGTIANVAAATFYVTADGRISNQGAGTGELNNAGVMAVFAGIGETDIDAAVNNPGYIQAQSGTLSLNGGGSSAGDHLYVANSAVIQFGAMAGGAAGGTFSISSGQYTAGDTAITGGTLDVSAASAAMFVRQLEITAGMLQLGALSDGVVQGALLQSGGLLEGSSLFTVYEGASLMGGVQSGPATTRLYGTSVLGGSFQLDGGRTVENDGWMNWSSGNIELGSGDPFAVTQSGSITNVSGSVFYVTADGRIGIGGGGSGTLNNAGVLAVFAGVGETDIDAFVSNTGFIQAQSGTLSLNGGGTSNAGNLYVAPNAVLQFGTTAGGTGGTFAFTGGPYIASNTVVNGSTVDLSAVSAVSFGTALTVGSGELLLGPDFQSAQTFIQTGGEVSGTGMFMVSAAAQLSGGLETGSGRADLQAGGSISGPVQFDGGWTLENDGTLTWSSGSITLGGGDPTAATQAATLVNAAGAVLQIETNGTINSAGFPGTGTIGNAGTILKSGGLGTTAVYANLFNNGVVDVTAGTLGLEQGVGGTGTFLLDGAATLDFVNGAGSSNTMQFLHPGGTLEVDSTGAFGPTISGFAAGDTIDARAVLSSLSLAPVFSGGTLTVSDSAGHSAAFSLSGSYNQSGFQLVSDGHGGTAVTYT